MSWKVWTKSGKKELSNKCPWLSRVHGYNLCTEPSRNPDCGAITSVIGCDPKKCPIHADRVRWRVARQIYSMVFDVVLCL